MMKQIVLKKILIIGLGSIGRRHLHIVKGLRPDLEIIVLRLKNSHTVSEEVLANKVIFSLDDAIAEAPGAAVISTPANTHADIAKALLEKGIPVLVEKPVTNNLQEALELKQINDRTAGKIFVGYCLRYDPNAIKFMSLLSENAIGEILNINIECGSYLPEWRPESDYRKSVSSRQELGGGVLLELSHELDYARWFFGEIKSVYSQYSNSNTLEIDVEDQADLLLTTETNKVINLHLDFNTHAARRHCIVRGSEGDLIWDAIQKKVTLKSLGNGQEYAEDYDRDFLYQQQMKDFIESIEQNGDPKISIEDGLQVLKMIDAARRSNDSGRMIPIG